MRDCTRFLLAAALTLSAGPAGSAPAAPHALPGRVVPATPEAPAADARPAPPDSGAAPGVLDFAPGAAKPDRAAPREAASDREGLARMVKGDSSYGADFRAQEHCSSFVLKSDLNL